VATTTTTTSTTALVNTIQEGDALGILTKIPDASVDMCITSPPFYKLRDYKVEGQIGQEATMHQYISKLVEIFAEVGRVLKGTGSLWVDLGDTFNGDKKGNTHGMGTFRGEGFHIRKGPTFKEGTNDQKINKHKEPHIKTKSLLMIPERFAIAMIDKGWCLRHKIVHFKPNAMPQSAGDRFTLDYDMLYHFVKQPQDYYFEQQYRPLSDSSMKEIKRVYNGNGIKFGGNKAKGYGTKTYSGKVWQPTVINTRPGIETGNGKSGTEEDPNSNLHNSDLSAKRQIVVRGPAPGSTEFKNAVELGWVPGVDDYAIWYFEIRQKKSWHNHESDEEMGFGHQKKQLQEGTPTLAHPYGSKMRSVWLPEDQDLIVWKISTKSYKGAHFATFAEQYVSIPIRATCPPQGVVLDCFMGAGTTALAALKQNRDFIGIELSPKYCEMARKRISPLLQQKKIFQWL